MTSPQLRRHERHDSSNATQVDGQVRLFAALAAGAALLATSLLAVVYVRGQSIREGYAMHDLRAQLMQQRQAHTELELERAQLLRPARLATIARDLGLAEPRADQVRNIAPRVQP